MYFLLDLPKLANFRIVFLKLIAMFTLNITQNLDTCLIDTGSIKIDSFKDFLNFLFQFGILQPRDIHTLREIYAIPFNITPKLKF